MKLSDVLRGQQREQKMREVLIQSGGDPTKASQALLGAGYPEEAAKLHSLIPKAETIDYNKAFLPGGAPNTAFQEYEMKKMEKSPTHEKLSSYAQQLVDEGIQKGTPDFYRRMNAYNLAESQGKGRPLTTVTNVMPGAKNLIDIPKFRGQVQDTIKPYIATTDAADTSLAMLELAIKQNNPTAYQGSRVQLAKAFGDSQITGAEIKAAGGDPSIWGALKDSASTLFTGTPSVETMNAMKKTLNALKKVAKTKGKQEIDIQKKIGKASGIKEEDIDTVFDFPDFKQADQNGVDTNNPLLR